MNVEKIVADHDTQIRFIVNRIAGRLPRHIDTEDLYNVGVIGLIDAIDKFDPKRDVKFSTYAEYRISGAIRDQIRTLDWVPRSIRQKGRQLDHAYAQVAQRFGRAGTEQEVADSMGLDLDKFHALVSQVRGTTLESLDAGDGSRGFTLGDITPDTSAPCPLSDCRASETQTIVRAAIKTLPETEAQVVSLHFYDGITMKAIGDKLGVTESRVSQIRTRAMKRLSVSLAKVSNG